MMKETSAPLVRVPPSNKFYRFMQRVGSSGVMPWINARLMHRLDGVMLRRTRGRWAMPGLFAGLPLITLTTIGARSGRRRTNLVVGLPDGDAIIVVASNWGEPQHPSWYYNLRANPAVMVAYRGRAGYYIAREATEAERERLWSMGDAIYRGYAAYRRRASNRRIPILILTPVAPDSMAEALPLDHALHNALAVS